MLETKSNIFEKKIHKSEMDFVCFDKNIFETSRTIISNTPSCLKLMFVKMLWTDAWI